MIKKIVDILFLNGYINNQSKMMKDITHNLGKIMSALVSILWVIYNISYAHPKSVFSPIRHGHYNDNIMISDIMILSVPFTNIIIGHLYDIKCLTKSRARKLLILLVCSIGGSVVFASSWIINVPTKLRPSVSGMNGWMDEWYQWYQWYEWLFNKFSLITIPQYSIGSIW